MNEPVIKLLQARLRRTLEVPVTSHQRLIDYRAAYNPAREQVDGETVLRFMEQRLPERGFFNFLIIEEALYMASEDWSFAFGVNNFNVEETVSWSVASLDQMFDDYEELNYSWATESMTPFAVGEFEETRLDRLAAARVYKLVIKNIARAAGFIEETGDVMRFPNSIDDLDDIPRTFLPLHRTALQAAGIMRP